jgi:hypothetical protein
MIMLTLISVHAKYFSLNALKSVDNSVFSFVCYLLFSALSAGCTLHAKVAVVLARNKIFTRGLQFILTECTHPGHHSHQVVAQATPLPHNNSIHLACLLN